jgi:hypothetical protein
MPYDGRTSTESQPADYTLVLVVTGNCEPCDVAQRMWGTWLDDIDQPTVRRLLVFPQGDPGNDLVPNFFSASQRVVNDALGFSMGTGIQRVPTALLLDDRGTVRLAVAGVPPERIRSAVARVVTGDPTGPAFTGAQSVSSQDLIPQPAETVFQP